MKPYHENPDLVDNPDPMAAPRGVGNGLLIAAAFWLVVIFGVIAYSLRDVLTF